VVSVMPCTAKKYEAQRPEMAASGLTDVDVVLTTASWAHDRRGRHRVPGLEDGKMDSILGDSSGAADILPTPAGSWRRRCARPTRS